MKYAALLLLTAIALVAFADPVSEETNSHEGRFDLTKLREFYDTNGMDGDAKVHQLVAYLRQELARPSQPAMGIGGGPIDTVYIQEVIIDVMVQTVPPASLLKAFNGESDKKIKDRIMFALLGAGDQTFVKDVLSLLRDPSDSLSRLAAVRALEKTKNQDVVPLLERMRYDRYSRAAFRNGVYHKVYPVRQAARRVIVGSGAKADDWALELPLPAASETQALGSILEDEDPEQCVTVLRTLEKRSGGDVKRIIENFAAQNAAKSHLAQAVQEARRILNVSEP
jgi:hypothetical protein